MTVSLNRFVEQLGRANDKTSEGGREMDRTNHKQDHHTLCNDGVDFSNCIQLSDLIKSMADWREEDEDRVGPTCTQLAI
jgi:hypothetical protein